MVAVIKPGWSKPSAVLFASEFPPNEKAFAFALSEAAEFGADLIIFHVYSAFDVPASGAFPGGAQDRATARDQKKRFCPFAQRAMDIGIHCKVVVRCGSAADQILTFLRERNVDRVVMGSRSPGPIGKLLVGSVAEAVLRNANVPVCIVGPNVVEGTFRNPVTRKILCDVSKQAASKVVANFGAELAAEKNASLILQQIIPPQEGAEVLADLSLHQIEAELPSLVPTRLQGKVNVQTRVTLGDPTEELLYQGRVQQANLIVLGAQGASHFAAITRAGTVYKVLAYAHCPVITLSPIVLTECGARVEDPGPSKVNYLAGVI
jgi:nucleotide-binding universal stress UspA family protein